MDGQSPLSDIQTYLATFNPKEQAQIILQQPDGTFIKGEDQGQIDDASSLEDQGISDQPLLTPAAPSIGDDQQLVQGTAYYHARPKFHSCESSWTRNWI